jgi:hypothetical protein
MTTPLVVFSMRKQIPTMTSHHPIIINPLSAAPNGSHTTVAFGKPSAGDRCNCFSIPNQINRFPNDRRIAILLVLLLLLIELWSNF